MEIHVTENAVNSLEVGLEFYNRFLDNVNSIDISVTHFGNLKFAVVALHNAAELLSKSILLDVNELLVFNLNVENEPQVCEMLKTQFDENKKKAHIAYWAVFDLKYKTIDYSKCINLIKNIFNDNLNETDIKTLEFLGYYRNTLTHLGYASIYEWYKILIVLNDTLKLIKDFYISNIRKAEQYFSEEVIKLLDETLIKSKKQLPDLWIASNEFVLDEINEKLDEYFDETIIIEDYLLDEEYDFYKHITFSSENCKSLKWTFEYSYLNESIIIIDPNNNVVCFISINDDSIKYFRDEENQLGGLKSFNIYVPKNIMIYNDDYRYDFKSSKNSIKIKVEDNKSIYKLIKITQKEKCFNEEMN